MSVQLYHGDCLEFMRTLPAGSVDAVVTDPPYGIDIGSSNRLCISRGFAGQSWDKERNVAEVSFIVSLGVPLVLWGGNYYADILPPSRGWLVWDKNNDGRDFGEFELAWTSADKPARRYKKFPVGMDGGKVHPTQKPIELMIWCMEYLGIPKGATVFDPFMGSGTTGVACVQTGRNFIGCEIDAGYFKIAQRRIKDAQQQPLLPFMTNGHEPRHEQLALEVGE